MTGQMKPRENERLKEDVKANSVIAAAKGGRFCVSKQMLIY